MSRRAKQSELETGSDSFLDIIANIVGILIILIVIAGVRVSQLPADSVAEVPTPAPVIESPVEEEEIEETPPLLVVLGPAEDEPGADMLPPVPEPIVEVVEEPEPPAAPEPSPELLAEIALLRRELSELSDDAGQVKPEIAKLLQSTAAARQQLTTVKQNTEQQVGQLTVIQSQLDASKKQMEKEMRHLAGLAEELEEEQSAPEEVKQLVHRLTPVSKEVDGPELHFRLENDRVSLVPIQRLIEELKGRIERRKSWLARSRAHHGQVGPIDGYRMRYLVERKPLSLVEELQSGRGMFRVIVSAWQMQVTPDLVSETAEEALQMDSRFVEALRSAPPGTTLTFWVYPDSFKLYRKLQAVARANDFLIAARPLPHGVPIAGSPHGTRSAGQ